jgi:hypothetical protein
MMVMEVGVVVTCGKICCEILASQIRNENEVWLLTLLLQSELKICNLALSRF